MSAEAVRSIVARAAAQPEFRALLLHKPAQALAGYDLSAPEAAALAALHAERFDAGAAQLDARISQVVLPVGLLMSSSAPSGDMVEDRPISSEVILAHE